MWQGTLLRAQDISPHPVFRQYTVEDGLPSSEVYQVKQDSKGYIWFATGNGVSRFDGYEFKNFSLEDGLLDNTVFEIFEDSRGRIWFLPLSCRLSYYENGKIHSYPYNYILQRFINPIKCSFYVADNGSVFIGIATQGIFEITATGRLITHALPATHPGFYYVMEPEPSHPVFFGNGNVESVPWIDVQTRDIRGRFMLPSIAKSSYAVYVFRLIRLHNRSFAFSFLTRLFLLTDKGEVTVHDFSNRLTWIYEDSDHDLWLGTYQNGVHYVPGGDFSKMKTYLDGNSVDGVLEDAEGGFWFTTEGNHVFYAPSKNMLVFDQSSGLQEERVNCLTIGKACLYAGMEEGYLLRMEDSLRISEKRFAGPGPGDNEVLSLFYDKEQDHIMVSGRGKVYMLDSKLAMVLKPNTNVFYRMVKSTDGRYWGGFSFGIYSYGSTIVSRKIPSLQRVNGLLAAADNHIWLGAMDGLWDFDANTLTLNNRSNRHPELKVRIMDIEYLGSDSAALVLATKGSGVLVYDFKNVIRIDTKRGLNGNNVNELFVDGHTVWAATNQGLNRIEFRPGQYPPYTVSGYTTRDGLPADEIKSVAAYDGRIWVATQKGLGFFKPDNSGQKTGRCPVYITRIQVNDVDTALQTDYRLAYSQNSLKIGFIGLGYRNAGKLQYRYRMLGLDSNWTYTENREIQFTTLPGGEYTFMVSVRNNDGTWNDKVATVRFFIVTPFWQKWWFQGLVILLLAALMLVIVRYRLKMRERDNELNRNLLTLKLKALRAQMNPHFTFNVMNSIQHFILNKDEESAHRYLSKFSRLIRTILNNSEADTVPLAEELKALELYLELETMRFDHSFAYHIEIDETIDRQRVLVPSMLMQPYVENAILHGILPLEGGGKIAISIHRRESLLECVIEDNGVGRVKAAETKRHKEYKSFGTSITKERLTAINALHNSFMSETIIDLFDGEGRSTGTRVVIYIPLIKTDEHESDYH